MAFSASSIVIVFNVVAAYALAGPVQGGPSSLQRDEYIASPALGNSLARYWEDRKAIQDARRNLDQIGGGHLVRDTDKQIGHLFERGNVGSILEYLNGKQTLDDRAGPLVTAERFHDGNPLDSSKNTETFANPANYLNLNVERANDESFVDQLYERDAWKNAREGDRRHVKNLDQIGGGHLVRNLDQIGGGHLVRNLDRIGGGNPLRSVGYPNGETQRHVGRSSQSGTSAKLYFARNLDQIGGGNLVRNLDQIGGGNLVRNLDQIGGGNLVRSFE